MKMQAVRTLLLGVLLVIVVMSIYFALLPESYYHSHNHNHTFVLSQPHHVHYKHRHGFQPNKNNSNKHNNSTSADQTLPVSLREAALDVFKGSEVVLFTMVNDAFFPFAASWSCNTAPFPRVHHRTLFLTTDVGTGRRLKGLWPELSVVPIDRAGGSEEDKKSQTGSDRGVFGGAQEYSHAGYVRMMVVRTRHILTLLEAGVRLLLFEVDCVWLRDPLPSLLAQASQADILATKVAGTDVTAGGFLLLNPTQPTVKLWRRLVVMMDDLQTKLGDKGEKTVVSEALNDQVFLDKLLKKRYAGIKVLHLPLNLFPDGKWYKQSAAARSAKPQPFLINNNWVIGDAAKIKRAKAFGHWFWTGEGENSHCNSTAVASLLK